MFWTFWDIYLHLEAVWGCVGKFLEDLGCFRTFWNVVGCFLMFGDVSDIFRHLFWGRVMEVGCTSNQPPPPKCHFVNSVKILGVTGKLAL